MVLFARREGLKVTQRTNKNSHKGERRRTRSRHARAARAAVQNRADRAEPFQQPGTERWNPLWPKYFTQRATFPPTQWLDTLSAFTYEFRLLSETSQMQEV